MCRIAKLRSQGEGVAMERILGLYLLHVTYTFCNLAAIKSDARDSKDILKVSG